MLAAGRRAVVVALIALVALPAAALARDYHGVGTHGQFVYLTAKNGHVSITSARLLETCRPGHRNQLVGPNFLTSDPLKVGAGGSFSATLRGGGASTHYEGTVGRRKVKVKIVDSADGLCEGGSQVFHAKRIG